MKKIFFVIFALFTALTEKTLANAGDLPLRPAITRQNETPAEYETGLHNGSIHMNVPVADYDAYGIKTINAALQVTTVTNNWVIQKYHESSTCYLQDVFDTSDLTTVARGGKIVEDHLKNVDTALVLCFYLTNADQQLLGFDSKLIGQYIGVQKQYCGNWLPRPRFYQGQVQKVIEYKDSIAYQYVPYEVTKVETTYVDRPYAEYYPVYQQTYCCQQPYYSSYGYGYNSGCYECGGGFSFSWGWGYGYSGCSSCGYRQPYYSQSPTVNNYYDYSDHSYYNNQQTTVQQTTTTTVIDDHSVHVDDHHVETQPVVVNPDQQPQNPPVVHVNPDVVHVNDPGSDTNGGSGTNDPGSGTNGNNDGSGYHDPTSDQNGGLGYYDPNSNTNGGSGTNDPSSGISGKTDETGGLGNKQLQVTNNALVAKQPQLSVVSNDTKPFEQKGNQQLNAITASNASLGKQQPAVKQEVASLDDKPFTVSQNKQPAENKLNYYNNTPEKNPNFNSANQKYNGSSNSSVQPTKQTDDKFWSANNSTPANNYNKPNDAQVSKGSYQPASHDWHYDNNGKVVTGPASRGGNNYTSVKPVTDNRNFAQAKTNQFQPKQYQPASTGNNFQKQNFQPKQQASQQRFNQPKQQMNAPQRSFTPSNQGRGNMQQMRSASSSNRGGGGQRMAMMGHR